MKCFVKPCQNHTHQGEFKGNVCFPCYALAHAIETENIYGRYHSEEGVVHYIADNWREVIEQSKK